jgi:peroxiredoxin
MKSFQQNLKTLDASDTQVLGVSMDSSFSNKAWAEKIGVTFPLLSDWGGTVTKEYGLFNPKYKASRRATFLIGKDGKVLEVQLDSQAIDPHNVLVACQRHKLTRQ